MKLQEVILKAIGDQLSWIEAAEIAGMIARQFMLSNYVRVQGWYPYPWISADATERGTNGLPRSCHKKTRLTLQSEAAPFQGFSFVEKPKLDP